MYEIASLQEFQTSQTRDVAVRQGLAGAEESAFAADAATGETDFASVRLACGMGHAEGEA